MKNLSQISDNKDIITKEYLVAGYEPLLPATPLEPAAKYLNGLRQWSGITATMVGLGNVTNESKSTMFTNPTFTGTVSGITATMVGLENVTNESKSTMFTDPTFTGIAKATGNTSYTTSQLRNIFLNTAAPTSGDGSNGDIWIIYT